MRLLSFTEPSSGFRSPDHAFWVPIPHLGAPSSVRFQTPEGFYFEPLRPISNSKLFSGDRGYPFFLALYLMHSSFQGSLWETGHTLGVSLSNWLKAFIPFARYHPSLSFSPPMFRSLIDSQLSAGLLSSSLPYVYSPNPHSFGLHRFRPINQLFEQLFSIKPLPPVPPSFLPSPDMPIYYRSIYSSHLLLSNLAIFGSFGSSSTLSPSSMDLSALLSPSLNVDRDDKGRPHIASLGSIQLKLMPLKTSRVRHFMFHSLIQSLMRNRFCRSGLGLRSLSIFHRLIWELSCARSSRSSYYRVDSLSPSFASYLSLSSNRLFALTPPSDSIMLYFLRFSNSRFSFHTVRKGASKVSVPVLSRYHDSLKFLLRSIFSLARLLPNRGLLARCLTSFMGLVDGVSCSSLPELVSSIRFYSHYSRVDIFRYIHRRRSGRSFQVPKRLSARGLFRSGNHDALMADVDLAILFLRHSLGFRSRALAPRSTLPNRPLSLSF